MITIKDIAKMTDLSITTVSKVLNNKTDEFSQETIDKVLKVAKKYNYTPYAKNKINNISKTFRIAYVARNLRKSILALIGILDVFREEGYSLLIYDSNDSIENENLSLNKVLGADVDGLIWEPIDLEKSEYYNKVKEFTNNPNNNFKTILINSFRDNPNNFFIDYEKMAYVATKKLIEKKHKNISCIYKTDSLRGSMTLKGYQKCMADHNILFRDEVPFDMDDFDNIDKDFSNITAIISSHFTATFHYENYINNLGMTIPDDISIISMMNQVRSSIEEPIISTIKIPNYEFGKFIATKIINYCETSKLNKDNYIQEFDLDSLRSVDISRFDRDPYTIILGSINMDNIMTLQDFPEQGDTKFSNEYLTEPGGKALIQAKALKLLGKNVALFGRIGNDENGNRILNLLNSNDINTSYITIDEKEKTGVSYIAVNPNGEPSMIIFNGANDYLNKQQINKYENIFKKSSFCLIQTDIPLGPVREAKKLCLENDIKVILRASSVNKLEDNDYIKLFVLIVNETEAKKLSNNDDINNQIRFFLNKGVENIVIYLEQEGIYWGNNNQIRFISSQNTRVVDETGAIDSFTAVLCSMLIDGNNMQNSLEAALIASNYTKSMHGAINSLIDNDNLNKMIKMYSIQ